MNTTQIHWTEGQCDWWGIRNREIEYIIHQRRYHPAENTDRFTVFRGIEPLEDKPDNRGIGCFGTLEEAQVFVRMLG